MAKKKPEKFTDQPFPTAGWWIDYLFTGGKPPKKRKK